MSTEMKYVVVNSEEAGEQLFIFPRTIDHDKFAEVLSRIRYGSDLNWEHIYRKPVAAGFTDGHVCYGRSETLSLNSRPQDTRLLRGDE